MVAITLDLDDEQARQLRYLAARQGRSVADLGRAAIAEYLARHVTSPAATPSGPAGERTLEEWRTSLEDAAQQGPALDVGPPHPQDDEAKITAARTEYRRERGGAHADECLIALRGSASKGISRTGRCGAARRGGRR
jgi:hypothetical protein